MRLEKTFGRVLRELRTSCGLSQEALALEAGLDRTFISLLERGLRQPSLTTLFVLSKHLRTKPSSFVAKVEAYLS